MIVGVINGILKVSVFHIVNFRHHRLLELITGNPCPERIVCIWCLTHLHIGKHVFNVTLATSTNQEARPINIFVISNNREERITQENPHFATSWVEGKVETGVVGCTPCYVSSVAQWPWATQGKVNPLFLPEKGRPLPEYQRLPLAYRLR